MCIRCFVEGGDCYGYFASLSMIIKEFVVLEALDGVKAEMDSPD